MDKNKLRGAIEFLMTYKELCQKAKGSVLTPSKILDEGTKKTVAKIDILLSIAQQVLDGTIGEIMSREEVARRLIKLEEERGYKLCQIPKTEIADAILKC